MMAEEKYGVMKGHIGDAPYNWTTGKTAGRLLQEFRDNRKFVGFKCPGCGKVYFPAKDICGECYVPLEEEPVEVGPEGEVISYTIVREANPESPAEAPYVLGMVKLDGADTAVIGLLLAGDKDVQVGMRVKPEWKEERMGHFSDLEGFVSA
ncbi:MAG: OB-fold domain-containing protein [Actinomycetota bacterium]|nr:OB-fold domain-containing protein [Actinomycetota bacterium]